ncbi:MULTISPECIES: diguanylate cyclase [unclassified Rubrivivax]|uniref:diguanylate cyclase n=1 Tax=unclassified Rubrivivax TaxID=2649762 RepID=UPI001E4255EC|nr:MULTISPECIES: diguanylate cyclase [unclassified Rubrivivax]MCC9597288.1 diguanylate cyclase [Rubrivivax sp. JA1055]MCC9646454.1 diguanylate cyclase [Rubrivivax sp. JA1029]
MRRCRSAAALWLALAGLPAFANGALEPQVAEIERLGVAAGWRDTNAKIQALSPQLPALSPEQRQRLEFVRLRMLVVSGDERLAINGFNALLKEPLPPPLRARAYATAISAAANVEEWTQAFTWLDEALSHLSEAPQESASLLGVASYLHTLVGEPERAHELAMRALNLVEKGTDQRARCVALSDVAMSEDHRHRYREAERWRRRQIEACKLAGDRIFTANAKYGIAKMAAAQGRHVEAVAWAEQALADFGSAGFTVGEWTARVMLAGSLVVEGRDLERAERLLTDTLRHYRGLKHQNAIAETEHHLALLAEKRGDPAGALAHYKQASEAAAKAESDARQRRVAFLQVQFDTRLKEQQIALLEAEKQVAALQVTAAQRRQWLLWVGVGGLALVAMLLTLLLRRAFVERRRYRWQSEHDGLTGLYNYQQVRKLGEAAFAAARRRGQPFTAIVADVDRFKGVNDHFGHAAGDAALRSLGGWIAEVVGARGIAGRSGGDEFTILLKDDAAQAEALLRQLRERIEPIEVFGKTVHFSISSGVCEAGEGIETLEQLVHEADQALYRAKHSGRNRIVRAGGDEPPKSRQAGLVVVGSGIDFGRHASERCLSEIREAEVVFCLVNPVALAMICSFRPDAINLGVHYAPGKDRRETYREIDDRIMAEVRAGRRVCAVFYGHPGVFADVPHRVVRQARAEGIPARMEPGISAEACLYADLGLDPGRRGVQSMEATHLMVYDRQLDSAGLVLLWQVALAGDLSCTRFHAERDGLKALVDRLLCWYPPEHEVILYEAAWLPIEQPRIERLALRDLPDARYAEYTTLVIPPLGPLEPAPAVMTSEPRATADSPTEAC